MTIEDWQGMVGGPITGMPMGPGMMGPGMMGPVPPAPMESRMDMPTEPMTPPATTGGGLGSRIRPAVSQAAPEGLPYVAMQNTLAQNIEANRAQQQSTQGMLAAARARLASKKGGRIGYKYGSGIKSLDAGAPSITYEGDMKMASAPDPMDALNDMSIEVYGKPLHHLTPEQYQMLIDMANEQAAAPGEKRTMVAIGGLPGIPRMAPDGLEYDMSQHGGFQPLGAQEGKDDVKANLAKNEFVFTADAVRGAGDGDIETGAQRMYDTMKRLEGRVA